MSGYVCIAMLEDPPYNMYLAATDKEPEDWCAGLPLPSHLLCYESFKDAQTIVKLYINALKAEGISAKVNKAFPAQPHKLIQAFISTRDTALQKRQLVDPEMTGQIDDDEDAELGEQYFEHAQQLELEDENRLALMKKAAEAGYRPAIEEVIEAYEMGWGCEENLEKAVDWIIDEDINLDGSQLSDLAEGFDLIDSNRPRLLKMAAEAGYTPAIGEVIEAYQNGWGCEENLEEAVDWIIQNNIEMTNDDFDEVLDNFVDEVGERKQGWYKLVIWRAEAGNANAMLETAEAYYYGWGTDKNHNYQQSLCWADQAKAKANELDTEHKLRIAELYEVLACEMEKGEGDFLEDPKKAKTLYKKAHQIYLTVANEDSFSGASGCMSLAIYYHYGLGVREDLNECINWSLKAGEKGCIDGFIWASDLLLQAGKRAQAEGVWKRYFEVLKMNSNDRYKWGDLVPRLTSGGDGKTYRESVECGVISPVHTCRDIATLEKLALAIEDTDKKERLTDFLTWAKKTLVKG